MARARGAFVVFGGIHTTLFPEEVRQHGAAHAVVTGDGDQVWPVVLADCERGAPDPAYQGGRIDGDAFLPARWDLLPDNRYMWGSADGARLSEALLLLFRLAHRRPEAAAAAVRRRRARDRRAQT
jgi:radical SAM superfamily enzyme YgiQ (UPF0313 family)